MPRTMFSCSLGRRREPGGAFAMAAAGDMQVLPQAC